MAGLKLKIVFAAIAFGAGLMAYGLGLHVQPVFSELTDVGLATPEPQLMREVSVGGLERDLEGRLKLTYIGKPPQACPT